jgi:hypothetical protein
MKTNFFICLFSLIFMFNGWFHPHGGFSASFFVAASYNNVAGFEFEPRKPGRVIAMLCSFYELPLLTK